MKDLVDRSLCAEELYFRLDSKFCGVHNRHGYPRIIEEGPMPFFSPWSDDGTSIQAFAIRRATSIRLSVPNVPRIIPLLEAELRPETDVVVEHGDIDPPVDNGGDYDTVLELPRCHSLFLIILIPCGCELQTPAGKWNHSSSSVRVSFSFTYADSLGLPINCCVVRRILTPTVKTLFVEVDGSGEQVKRVIGRWLTDPEVVNMDLSGINVEVWVRTNDYDKDHLRQFIARVFLNCGFSKDRLIISISHGY
ncbi:hypothetical protein A1Q2_07595 [Trichosporon asahii var. asahii CBS 8904]|uniref:Uncharacterized protein n=1 Tax=Trichosporon asahii var. asahii (strain CBS 8904) TaxID=1220162 RepID=K1V2A2_TRIAC|nr:hypothetical protein A1Q2_07595 [Trichosporon asahii var. asahii CBS 8904]